MSTSSTLQVWRILNLPVFRPYINYFSSSGLGQAFKVRHGNVLASIKTFPAEVVLRQEVNPSSTQYHVGAYLLKFLNNLANILIFIPTNMFHLLRALRESFVALLSFSTSRGQYTFQLREDSIECYPSLLHPLLDA